jgi:hypothetical protein
MSLWGLTAQSGDDAVKVLVRVRPPSDAELLSGRPRCLQVAADHRALEVRPHLGAAPRTLPFDAVADESASQAEVFETVGRPLAEQCVAGRNGAVFVYGQTGAGKTHTMHGPPRGGPEGRGLAPRMMEYLFALIEIERAEASQAAEQDARERAAGDRTRREKKQKKEQRRQQRKQAAADGDQGGGKEDGAAAVVEKSSESVANDLSTDGDDGDDDDDDDDDEDELSSMSSDGGDADGGSDAAGGGGGDNGDGTPVSGSDPATATATAAASVPRFHVECSFIEIYNENIFDLLHDPRAPPAATPLQRREAHRRMRELESADRDPWRAIAMAMSDTRGSRQRELPGMDTSMHAGESPLKLRKAGVLTSRNTVETLRGVPALRLREDRSRGTYVEGMNSISVESPAEAMQVLLEGERNRAIGETTMNRLSSRGHTVFTFTVTVSELKNGIEERRSSRMHLVDLAGSERIHAQQQIVSKLQKAESASINKSLVALGSVIAALSKHAGKHPDRRVARFVPYRLSKLTHLLKDALGGNSRTCMIANVTASELHAGETISTLTFASRAKEIRTRSEVASASVTKEELMAQVQRLSRELLLERVRVRALSDLRCRSCGAGFGDTTGQGGPHPSGKSLGGGGGGGADANAAAVAALLGQGSAASGAGAGAGAGAGSSAPSPYAAPVASSSSSSSSAHNQQLPGHTHNQNQNQQQRRSPNRPLPSLSPRRSKDRGDPAVDSGRGSAAVSETGSGSTIPTDVPRPQQSDSTAAPTVVVTPRHHEDPAPTPKPRRRGGGRD